MDQNNQQNQDYDDPNPELFPIEVKIVAMCSFVQSNPLFSVQ